MYGGPSHIDTFDYKPDMVGMDGKTIDVKTFGRGGKKNQGRIVEPRWKFNQYGQCGKYVSDLFPNVAKHVDDIAFVHSMQADSPIHGSAMLMMNSGSIISGKPSLGSWVNYGTGQHEPKPPRLRRHAGQNRRPYLWSQELDLRLHARLLPRHGLSAPKETPFSTSNTSTTWERMSNTA